MIFTEEEIELIKLIGESNPVIEKLWREYNSYQTDASKVFYKSLSDATLEISAKINNKTLDMTDKYTKGILKLISQGNKILTTLDIYKLSEAKSKKSVKNILEDKKAKKGTDIAI